MQSKLLLKKLKDFRKYIKQFVLHEKKSADDIHKLRIKSRELSSLLSAPTPFYNELKKIIKLSNKIRDMDVFFEEYLDSLPQKYLKKLDMKSIKISANKRRKKQLEKLYMYLKSIETPNKIELRERKSKNISIDSSLLVSPNQTLLHKYRILIKQKLYQEKNSISADKKRVKVLTKIKDILGNIHDNINALEILDSFKIEDRVLKKIYHFTQEKNLKLFKKFKHLDSKYIRSLS